MRVGSSERQERPLELLLVEDNAADARLTMELVRDDPGFRIHWVPRLNEAMEALSAARYDLILLDLLLPDGQGIGLVHRLRALVPDIPVVVLSGLGEDDLRLARSAIGEGAQDYIPKGCLDPLLLRRSLLMAIERAQLERALRRREAQLEEAQRLARMGDWWWSRGARGVELSRQLLSLLGLPSLSTPCPFRRLLRLLSPRHGKELCRVIRSLHREKRQAEIELDLEVEGGVRIFLLELRRREGPGGALQGLFGICREVTEQRRIERLKNEFVSVVSHELRTPLTSILGALGLIRGLHGEDLPETAGRLLETAHRNGERLRLLVDDLLDLERIERGALSFRIRRIELCAHLRDLVRQHAVLAEENGVHLIAELPEAPVHCQTDPDRLAQAVANLLSNALKFSPEGGTVRLRLEPLAGQVRIRVEDEGPGVPVQFRDRLFQKFAQADSSDQRVRQGTGLGLAIVRALMERLDGSCGFEAREGGGSVFFLELPVAPKLPRAA